MCNECDIASVSVSFKLSHNVRFKHFPQLCVAVTVKALIAEFEEMQLLQADVKGRDSNDRHYFGLVRSMVIGVRRMMSWCDRYDARSGNRDTKKMAIGLLMAMSMLDRTRTPTSLFTDRFLCACIPREHGAWVHVSAPPTS